jgi:hypothetical protein
VSVVQTYTKSGSNLSLDERIIRLSGQ